MNKCSKFFCFKSLKIRGKTRGKSHFIKGVLDLFFDEVDKVTFLSTPGLVVYPVEVIA